MAQDNSRVTAKNSDLIPRIAVAVIGIPLLVSLSIFGPNWMIWAIIMLASGISAWEFLRMTLQRNFRYDGAVALSVTIFTTAVIYWTDIPAVVAIAIFASVVAMFSTAMFTLQNHQDALVRLGGMFTSFTYITLLFGAYTLLIKASVLDVEASRASAVPYQAGWFLLPMFIIWGGDTGAYFIGRAFGKHKLAPRISPGKTWEGAAGGIVASILGAFIAAWLLPLPAIHPSLLILIALPAAVLGQIGDLCMSLVKRATGFKDSSSILYGHGGMLDRVDALIFASPWILIARELWLH